MYLCLSLPSANGGAVLLSSDLELCDTKYPTNIPTAKHSILDIISVTR